MHACEIPNLSPPAPSPQLIGFTVPSVPVHVYILEMALLRRQAANYEIFDDQSPTLWGSYVGNWTHYTQNGFNNDTVTATPTPGASLTFTFSGTQVVDHRLC